MLISFFQEDLSLADISKVSQPVLMTIISLCLSGPQNQLMKDTKVTNTVFLNISALPHYTLITSNQKRKASKQSVTYAQVTTLYVPYTCLSEPVTLQW